MHALRSRQFVNGWAGVARHLAQRFSLFLYIDAIRTSEVYRLRLFYENLDE